MAVRALKPLSGNIKVFAHSKQKTVFLPCALFFQQIIRKHDRSVKIVFLTSTSAFAVDSYTVHADNYLLKPVAQDKLLLEDGFFKYHRSYIVNIYRIVTYMQKEIRMQSGFRIPVSRSCHAEFESAYFDLLFGKTDDLKIFRCIPMTTCTDSRNAGCRIQNHLYNHKNCAI